MEILHFGEIKRHNVALAYGETHQTRNHDATELHQI